MTFGPTAHYSLGLALLTEHDASLQGGADERRAERRMLEEIDTLWHTAPLRAEKPTPVDEVRAIMAIFDETLYTAVPHVYRRVDDALQGPAAGNRAPEVTSKVIMNTTGTAAIIGYWALKVMGSGQ